LSVSHQSAFLLASRNASPRGRALCLTSLLHFLVEYTTCHLLHHLVWLNFSWLSIGGTPFRVAWRLTSRRLIGGAREPTPGYVKLLLPPRQSRGNSHFGLGAGISICRLPWATARTQSGTRDSDVCSKLLTPSHFVGDGSRSDGARLRSLRAANRYRGTTAEAMDGIHLRPARGTRQVC
jgi:hypothetical protein